MDQNTLDVDFNIDLNSDSDEDDSPFGELPLNFDSEDMLAQIKQVVQEETGVTAKSENIENTGESPQGKEREAMKSIFDQIDELDKYL